MAIISSINVNPPRPGEDEMFFKIFTSAKYIALFLFLNESCKLPADVFHAHTHAPLAPFELLPLDYPGKPSTQKTMLLGVYVTTGIQRDNIAPAPENYFVKILHARPTHTQLAEDISGCRIENHFPASSRDNQPITRNYL
jgi:hypothetical protein